MITKDGIVVEILFAKDTITHRQQGDMIHWKI